MRGANRQILIGTYEHVGSLYDLPMDVVIRSGTVDDLDAVLELWRAAEAELTHTDDIPSLQRLLAFDSEALLVAQGDDDLVGTVTAAWDGWRGSVYRLTVVPGHRRRGLAGDLLQAAMARLRKAGAVRLQATVVEIDDRAMGFWNSTGWELQVERARFVKG